MKTIALTEAELQSLADLLKDQLFMIQDEMLDCKHDCAYMYNRCNPEDAGSKIYFNMYNATRSRLRELKTTIKKFSTIQSKLKRAR